jgi:hypothetical protein
MNEAKLLPPFKKNFRLIVILIIQSTSVASQNIKKIMTKNPGCTSKQSIFAHKVLWKNCTFCGLRVEIKKSLVNFYFGALKIVPFTHATKYKFFIMKLSMQT